MSANCEKTSITISQIQQQCLHSVENLDIQFTVREEWDDQETVQEKKHDQNCCTYIFFFNSSIQPKRQNVK